MKKIKSSRALSFTAVAFVYVIAAVCGILIYNALDNASLPFQLSLLIADVAATVITFVFSLIFGNASVYDPYWSVQPIVILWYAVIRNGFSAVVIMPLVAVTFWGLRLTANWAYTFKGLDHQDWRYTMLREKSRRTYPLVNFFGIHLFPTIVVYLCTLPAVYMFVKEAQLRVECVFCFLISVGAVILQTVSDFQMHSFRKKNTGGLIRVGLWKYARHPNYLGEILMWWGIGLYSVLAMRNYPYLLVGALVNTLMFVFISVPMADKRQSKKPGFEEYKKETRVFLPVKKVKRNDRRE